ncbi:DUF5753 domain-containing protein [Lentzea sp. DG1S-22]|uniref:DUF5753 domain-containing protein n=1 Tax=Lentzea sp. DG1S-22 TaxID=3108822 RepID=UPI002E79EBF0|nr:DUF5753 domain-containing protein [Lentzea sp. DG1S-22]WVH77590.1 DUF5753 domain-containing protein [Lentzea sp. DG1S-22]
MTRRFSTARGREFGVGMRAALEGASLTGNAAARMLDWDPSKVSNLLNGKGGVSQLEVAVLLGMCRVNAGELARLLTLHQDTHIRGWWQQHGRCAPVRLHTVVEHLKVARTLTSWHTHMVPLFLQTAHYMREVLLASSTVPQDEVLDRVQAQLAMQDVLRLSRTKCTFFIHELALHLRIGGAEVYVGQLLHLLSMSAWKNVSIRIVPAALGAHAGLAGSFTHLTLDTYEPLVWVATENSSLFDETPDAVEGYDNVVRALDDTSWDEETSTAFIASLCDGLPLPDADVPLPPLA